MSILTDAQNLIKSGDKNKAGSLLQRHLKVRPKDEKAWLLLSYCVDSSAKRYKYLSKVLLINPNNILAQQGLARLRGITQPRKSFKFSSVAAIVAFGLMIPLASAAALGYIYQEDVLAVLTPKSPVTESTQNVVSAADVERAVEEKFHLALAADGAAGETFYAAEPFIKSIPLPSIPSAFCVPEDAKVEEGKVVEVTNAQTLQVEISDEIVVVRYLGIKLPEMDESLQQYGINVNRTLAGHTVLLVSEGENENEAGELLRYVFAGEYFINYQLTEMGLAIIPKEQSG